VLLNNITVDPIGGVYNAHLPGLLVSQGMGHPSPYSTLLPSTPSASGYSYVDRCEL